MHRIWRVVIAAILLFSSTPVLADPLSVAMLSGRWTYDATRSRELDPDLRITNTVMGLLRSEGGPWPPYEFDLAGGSHTLSNGRTITWVPTAHYAWLATMYKNGDVVETFAVTLSGNILRSALRGKLPNGSPYERTVTYRRAGLGEGLVGLWRSIKVDTGVTWDEFVISTVADVVTWRIPTDLQVITGPFDGSDLAIVGPTGPTGSTMAMRTVGPRRFIYVMKNGGQIAERGIIRISRDGRWLTELTWKADAPDRKSRLVYRRDSAAASPSR